MALFCIANRNKKSKVINIGRTVNCWKENSMLKKFQKKPYPENKTFNAIDGKTN